MSQTSQIIAELNNATEKAVKKITLDVVANLQSPPPQGGTPVDTGWARANWVVDVTTPFRVQAEQIGSISGRAAESEASKAKLAISYNLSMGPTFASNNVPYVLKLNDGSSKQAPQGFVQNAIIKAVRIDMRGFKP